MMYLVLLAIVVIGLIMQRHIKQTERSYKDNQCLAVSPSLVEGANPGVGDGAPAGETAVSGKGESANLDTAGLMVSVLESLGCQPKMDENGVLEVAYQGELFRMEFGGYNVRVWDPGWAQISLNDPNWPDLREAINITNLSFGPTVVYTLPPEEGMANIHSRRDIILHPSVPDNKDYMQAVLNSFFEIKETLREKFHSRMEEHQAPIARRRPVGFADTGEPAETDETGA